MTLDGVVQGVRRAKHLREHPEWRPGDKLYCPGSSKSYPMEHI